MSGTVTSTNLNGVSYALTLVPAGPLNLPPASYTLTITDPAGGGGPTSVTRIPPANVLLSSGGTFTIASLLLGSNYVIPPGVTGSVDIAVNLISTPNTIYVGGTATISSAVTLLGSLVVDVDGGTVNAAGGTVLGALSGLTINLDNGGTFSNGAALISALNGTIINFGANGGTFVANANGSVINLSTGGPTINGFNAGKDQIEFQNLPAAIDHYAISAVSGGSQTITLFGSNNATLGTVTVAGTNLTAGTVLQGQSGPLTITGSGSTFFIDPVASTLCFLAGTRMTTADGEKAVESLKIGDVVVTANGDLMPITFIGYRRIDLANHKLPQTVSPIRILAGVLADGIPERDLLVSPDHALYLSDVLVPARDLVDGICIKQDTSFRSVDYYHIELEHHAILIAEGALAESFLNVGHRGMFENSGEPIMLHPELWHKERETGSCAPLVFEGEKLAAIRTQLYARVQALGFSVAENTQLMLNIDGEIIVPSVHEGKSTFAIPVGATSAVLSSPVFAPAEINPASGDRRILGVAITQAAVDGRSVPLQALLDMNDLHDRAAGETATWTRGNVHVTLPPGAATISFEVVGRPQSWHARAA